MKTVASKPTTSRKKWKRVVSQEVALQATRIATEIADRMLEGDRLADNLTALPELTASSPMRVLWDGYGLMQGFAGLAAMYNQLDRCFPKEGWRRAGTHFLKISREIYQNSEPNDTSLCSGSAGLAYIALQSPRGKSNYRTLTDSIHSFLDQDLAKRLDEMSKPGGIGQGQYDVLYGVTGIGRYLLECENQKQPSVYLIPLLKSLIARSNMNGTTAGLCTPFELLSPTEQEYTKGTSVNCGLAHGVPGPLALMALALQTGVEVDGLADAVRFWSDWVMKHSFEDQWGINWPSTVVAGEIKPNDQSRAAWCYGAPGVARSLYIAGDALQDSGVRDFAVQGMLAVFRRPLQVQRNEAPTFCHGRAGLLQITLRFAVDTGLPEFQEHSQALCKELVETFKQEKLWGYQDSIIDVPAVDNPGLLSGAAGVVLTLLSAACDVEPMWDQTFLLS